MDFTSFIKDPEKTARSLVRKLTHSGEVDLSKQDLVELKNICKSSKEDLIVIVYKECMKCLHKNHSQVRVSTIKLIDYLFYKSHVMRERILDNFDTFLELSLAITQKPKLKLKLPPPKKFSLLLQEVTAKCINSWHSDFGIGYEKIRYIYRFLREHQLVDFSHFQVRTHEDIITQQKMAEKQERILTRSIENRLREFRELKPEIEQVIAQIESLLDILLQKDNNLTSNFQDLNAFDASDSSVLDFKTQQEHGIADISQGIEIEFNPYVEVQRDQDNKDVVQNLKELKRQLIEGKLTKLVSIEKTLSKRSEQFLTSLREIIELKSKATNMVLKLGELKIINDSERNDNKHANTLDNLESESDVDSEFEDVEPKEDLETYIPKSMRSLYGLESINPRELDESKRISFTDNIFENQPCSSKSSGNLNPVVACNVRLETGKLCQRKDKIKCPFHGKIIPRDHLGVPIDEDARRLEEEKTRKQPHVPDWQDPELLRDIKAAIGIDLTMPDRKKSKVMPRKKLANTKTCDLTPQQRLKKRLALLNK